MVFQKGDDPHGFYRMLTKVVKAIREQYSKFIEAVDSEENTDNELVDITSTDWYKKINSEMKPKDYLKTYRKVHNLT